MADASIASGPTRSSRAFTLPSPTSAGEGAPTKEADRAPQAYSQQQHQQQQSHSHPHLRHHRHHRSQQIGTRDHPHGSAGPGMPSTSAQISELFSPMKSAATNLSALGASAKNASFPAGTSTRAGSPERSKEEAEQTNKNKNKHKPWKTDPSWKDVQRERTRNKRVEEYMRTSYSRLVTSTSESAARLHTLQASLDGTLSSTRALVSQLTDLQRSAARHLENLTTNSLSSLDDDSRTRLAALRRAHAVNSRTQLATLEARVTAARGKAEQYWKRVEVCAQRVAVHEERERREVRRHKTRIGVFWAILAAVVALWLAAAVWRGKDRLDRHHATGVLETERMAGNEELRSALRSRGVEWALTKDAGVVNPTVRYSHGSGSLDGPRSSAARGDRKLERMFESV